MAGLIRQALDGYEHGRQGPGQHTVAELLAATTPSVSATRRRRQRCRPSAVLQALSRNSSGSPVSTRLLRLDKIIGQPGVLTFSSDPPGSSPR